MAPLSAIIYFHMPNILQTVLDASLLSVYYGAAGLHTIVLSCHGSDLARPVITIKQNVRFQGRMHPEFF